MEKMGHFTHLNSLDVKFSDISMNGLGKLTTLPEQTLPPKIVGHCTKNSSNIFTVSIVLEPENFNL